MLVASPLHLSGAHPPPVRRRAGWGGGWAAREDPVGARDRPERGKGPKTLVRRDLKGGPGVVRPPRSRNV